MATTLRRVFPPSGHRYELFDCSVLLLALGGIGYVLTTPPPNTEATLTILRFISEESLGWSLAGAGLIGIIASYVPAAVRFGYGLTIFATGSMSLFFAFGWALNQTDIRSVLSAILYGWIARRLIRDNEDER